MSPVVGAFLLTLLAGLATSIGGLLGVLGRSDNRRALSLSLGFAAGVMLYVAFMEILPKGMEQAVSGLGETTGAWAALALFFVGMGLSVALEHFAPEVPKMPRDRKGASKEADRRRLMRLGLVTGVILALHNFPEGFATFMAGLTDPSLALPIAVAIAIHNIPEGLAVAAPIYRATRSRKRGFLVATASGLSEPVGALVGWLLLRPFLSDTLLGLVFSAIAGIMVHLSTAELLPTAHEFSDDPPLGIYGLGAGMAVMGVSLLLL